MSTRLGDVTPHTSLPWLFSCRIDLLTFLGSAAIALGLLIAGIPFGLTDHDTPDWLWVGAVLMIDVAHVYATGFRVYFDRRELRRRPWLYGLTPVLAFLLGWAVHSENPIWFWRILAYLAVFHFVRQQYGWVALYRSRERDFDRTSWWIDTAAIYFATIYPLIYWHAHLPRRFWWFLPGDFSEIPIVVAWAMMPFYWAAMVVYVGHCLYRGFVHGVWNPGKDVVVATTAVCWYVGIITFNSDYAFTVTNVIIHGLPYMVLVYFYWNRPGEARTIGMGAGLPLFLGVVWALAFLEEWMWDCGVWHERRWLFGTPWHLGVFGSVLAPLLAVPQITHYVLDGFIWRRKTNRDFATLVNAQPTNVRSH